MKILFINGSPKSSNSASEIWINALRWQLGDSNEYATLWAMGLSKREFIDGFAGIDAAVFVFPLYVDGIPSHLLRLLYESKDELANPDVAIYAIANNGFFEGTQNAPALDMIRHFCETAGVKWGQGMGIGGGGMASAAPVGVGPLKSIGVVMKSLADNISGKTSGENLFVQPNIPKLFYKYGGHSQWKRSAKKNGLKLKDLYKRH